MGAQAQVQNSINLDYICTLHSKSKGWITKAQINSSGYKQWHYKYIELQDLDFSGENIYNIKYVF